MKRKKHLPGWVVAVVIAAVVLIAVVIYYKGSTPQKVSAETAIKGLREAAAFDPEDSLAADIHKIGGVMPCTYYSRRKLKVPPNCQLNSIWVPPSARGKLAEVMSWYSGGTAR